MKKINVLIVDDSASIRQMFSEFLSAEADICVLDTACDPIDARDKIKRLNPDVITLDIEMPKMDGLSFLEKIMTLRPMPVIMISSLTEKGAAATLRALELGAFETIHKPAGDEVHGLERLRAELVAKVRAAALANINSLLAKKQQSAGVIPYNPNGRCPYALIAIGASTGGVEAIREIFQVLPAGLPPIVITQHMPELFTRSFANRLNSLSQVKVHEAQNHERIVDGYAYLAPGGRHLKVVRVGQEMVCKLDDSPPFSGHRPSVDVLFHSVAEVVGAAAMGIILTGMGKDGADGLRAMRERGALTVSQNKESCVVYGMPQAAMKVGAVQHEVALHDVAQHIVQQCQKSGVRAS